jgi:hypothetical protein
MDTRMMPTFLLMTVLPLSLYYNFGSNTYNFLGLYVISVIVILFSLNYIAIFGENVAMVALLQTMPLIWLYQYITTGQARFPCDENGNCI